MKTTTLTFPELILIATTLVPAYWILLAAGAYFRRDLRLVPVIGTRHG